jgi:sulfide:quinone oxidoreductase
MQRTASPDKHRVVIAGGGVAALEAMLALRQLAEERVELTLVAPDRVFTYRPLSVAEPFGLGSVVRFPLEELAAGCGATYEQASLALVSPNERSIYTSRSRSLEYDALLLAVGASVSEALPGAVTFGGPSDTRAIDMLLEDLESGLVRRVVFAGPTGVGWTLPLYELALLTADRVASARLDAELTLVTPEERPLGVFGSEASKTIESLLSERGVLLRSGVHSCSFTGSQLEVVGGEPIAADWVLTLPRLTGRVIDGVPHDKDGFIATDEFGRIKDVPGAYAAGDMTNFPVKQGGIAAQQADAAAEAIAADAGADITPRPFEPVLRGLLLTGGQPAFLRAEIGGGHGETSIVYREPLWWPAGKIAARYLGPYLAEHARSESGSRYEPSRLLL